MRTGNYKTVLQYVTNHSVKNRKKTHKYKQQCGDCQGEVVEGRCQRVNGGYMVMEGEFTWDAVHTIQ